MFQGCQEFEGTLEAHAVSVTQCTQAFPVPSPDTDL